MTFGHRDRRIAAALAVVTCAGMLLSAAPGAAAATGHPATLSATAGALVKQIQTRFPNASVQINRIGGHQRTYAVYVVLPAQPHASLAGGAGAQVLAWYVHAYPHQSLYALYSSERDRYGMGLWEYEYVPAAKVLRRYRFAMTSKHPYPWTSWHLTYRGLLQAAQAGSWPSNGVTHAPVTPATHPTKKK
ncbi:MAG: hypothetical protein NVSMB65_00730 [Chloroflexota bacterium]